MDFERFGFDAMYAAFRRSVSRCLERGGERWISSGLVLTRFTQRSGAEFRAGRRALDFERFGFDAMYAAFRRSVSRCLEVYIFLDILSYKRSGAEPRHLRNTPP